MDGSDSGADNEQVFLKTETRRRSFESFHIVLFGVPLLRQTHLFRLERLVLADKEVSVPRLSCLPSALRHRKPFSPATEQYKNALERN